MDFLYKHSTSALLLFELLFVFDYALGNVSTGQILVEPHCSDSIRIRIAPDGTNVKKNLPGALGETCGSSSEFVLGDNNSVSNGNLEVTVSPTSNTISITRRSDGKVLLHGEMPSFNIQPLQYKDTPFYEINASFSTFEMDAVYGLGQLEAEDQKSSCSDGSEKKTDLPDPCAPPLNRRLMLNGGQTLIQSVKYHIAVPFLYSTNGFALFFNFPGEGIITTPPNSTTIGISFSHQIQFDMWVTTFEAPSQTSAVPSDSAHTSIYMHYGEATGFPSIMRPNALRFWQSRNAYHNQSEVIELATNFSKRNLSVGVIVIDLGISLTPPYYMLDKQRFPDVPDMVSKVKALIGADIMPNLKPTSIASKDCPDCDPGVNHAVDGKASDGKIDPTSATCRNCSWTKRIGPLLYDQGIQSYWLDDDELDRFHLESGNFSCGPSEYCGLYAAGNSWVQIFSEGTRANNNIPLILSRNMWAGSTQYGVGLWSSDIACTWTELQAQVSVVQAASLSGIPFWTSDVGGFFGTPSPELYARWHQFGSVCPIYRTHGSRTYNEPWSFGPQAEESVIKSITLRESLFTYIQELASNASKYNTPIVRPLWWDFPTDSVESYQKDATFMFGPKYLAAPVLTNGARSRSLYLPGDSSESWVHYYTHQEYKGGVRVEVNAPLDELPLFIRKSLS
eukprot:m.13061 g.13061  ORF g.13061 m.13061 type:complete len:676 (-) comp4784_c0_seq2:27-2054(-)